MESPAADNDDAFGPSSGVDPDAAAVAMAMALAEETATGESSQQEQRRSGDVVTTLQSPPSQPFSAHPSSIAEFSQGGPPVIDTLAPASGLAGTAVGDDIVTPRSASPPTRQASTTHRLTGRNHSAERDAVAVAEGGADSDDGEAGAEGEEEEDVFVEAVGPNGGGMLVLAARGLGFIIAAAVIISGLLLLGVVRLGLSALISHVGVGVVLVIYILGARTVAKRAGLQLPGDISHSIATVYASSSSSSPQRQTGAEGAATTAPAAAAGGATGSHEGGAVQRQQQREAQWRVLRAVAANACS